MAHLWQSSHSELMTAKPTGPQAGSTRSSADISNSAPPKDNSECSNSMMSNMANLSLSSSCTSFLSEEDEPNNESGVEAKHVPLVEKLVNLMAILPGSMIASMLPVVNRFSLRTVNIVSLLNNPMLRHRFLFSVDLVFKPLDTSEDGSDESFYWEKVRNEIEWLLIWQANGVKPPELYEEYHNIPLIYIPLFLNEMREILSGISFQNQEKFPAYELIESEKIIGLLEYGLPIPFYSFLPALISNFYSSFRLLCKKNVPIVAGLPVYELLDHMLKMAYQMPDSSDEYVYYLRAFMEIVETLKLESVNVHLRIHRSVLIDIISKYEYECISGSATPKLFTILKNTLSEIRNARVDEIFYEMVWKITIFHISFADIPETFQEDLLLFKNAERSLDLILRIFIFLHCLKERTAVLNDEFVKFVTTPNGFFTKLLTSSLSEQKRNFRARCFSSQRFEDALYLSVLGVLKEYPIGSFSLTEQDIKAAICISLTYFSPIHQSRLFAISKLRLKPIFISFLRGNDLACTRNGQITQSLEPIIVASFSQLKAVVTYNFKTFHEYYSRLVEEIKLDE
ncbi:Protein SOSEKI 1 [Mitosporidium daphniae]|uniref:Uncharacterized protein n=1 Tax=Mitosporidium daphniae TaxID=1485682 RepID=A0A098VNA6_9MICR|nr:uncharacterized protein DI09_65p100 [Mitosporidium daphniae]KGG50562.1 hypothetical protein DI09_65p100 [Mitosporidium daphniae]|eukprot:XP_013236989.1 uncharacterized protein DI09_65p100 [Mitosporidium daphniae]